MSASRRFGTISFGRLPFEIVEFDAEELPAEIEGDLRTGGLDTRPGVTLIRLTYRDPEARKYRKIVITLRPDPHH